MSLKIAYEQGYHHGFYDGYYKANLFIQINPDQFNQGLTQGWDLGFSEGTMEGVKIVFLDAKKQGIDLLTNNLDDYLTNKYRFNSIKYSLKKKNFKKQKDDNNYKTKFKAIYKLFLDLSDSKKIKLADRNPKKLLNFIDMIYANKANSSKI
mmetsp:Transcript_15101/g.13253  ORF Transcript_15101/g.13253 Transcript_15101/m.13253 type:complete len:151 (-) Transcript_15101:77-529(-)